MADVRLARVNPDAAQAVKAAAISMLRLTGSALLLIGLATATLAAVDSTRATHLAQGLVWMIVGGVLTVFAQLVPRPESID